MRWVRNWLANFVFARVAASGRSPVRSSVLVSSKVAAWNTPALLHATSRAAELRKRAREQLLDRCELAHVHESAIARHRNSIAQLTHAASQTCAAQRARTLRTRIASGVSNAAR